MPTQATIGFQPALPMRGVTHHVKHVWEDEDISTRTPHAGSDLVLQLVKLLGDISTRTPHAGSDLTESPGDSTISHFNPHSPCGE